MTRSPLDPDPLDADGFTYPEDDAYLRGWQDGRKSGTTIWVVAAILAVVLAVLVVSRLA